MHHTRTHTACYQLLPRQRCSTRSSWRVKVRCCHGMYASTLCDSVRTAPCLGGSCEPSLWLQRTGNSKWFSRCLTSLRMISQAIGRFVVELAILKSPTYTTKSTDSSVCCAHFRSQRSRRIEDAHRITFPRAPRSPSARAKPSRVCKPGADTKGVECRTTTPALLSRQFHPHF